MILSEVLCSMVGHPKVCSFSHPRSNELFIALLLSMSRRLLLKVRGRSSFPFETAELHLIAGVDIICAQGGEGGGHTGDTPFSVLIPACVDMCKNVKSPLTGKPVIVVASGGIADGRGLAASLSYETIFLQRFPIRN